MLRFPSLTSGDRWDSGKKREAGHAGEGRGKVRQILEKHHPVYVDEKISAELERMAVAFKTLK